MMRIVRFALGTLALSLVMAVQASGEPVRITGGSLNVPSQAAPAPTEVSGTRGFTFTGTVEPLEGVVEAFSGCTPCTIGSMIPVGATLLGTFFGTATLDGSSYALEINNINPHASMAWNISAPSVTAPAESTTTQFLQAPFSLTGYFTPDATPPDGMPVQIPMFGRGTVMVGLRPLPATEGQPFLWNTDSVRYTFSDATVTPEPASLILMGIGTAMYGLRRALATRASR